MKALLIEDDVDLAALIAYALRREGYSVVTANDGQDGLDRWAAERPDIVLLDCNLPKLDGLEVCRQIRHQAKTPIIMLTARDLEDQVLRGLQQGADDYITKPFSIRVLTARMAAVLRRVQVHPESQATREVRTGDLVLDLESHEVTRAGRPVQLTRLEFRILYLMAVNPGQVVPYSRLAERTWGYYDGASSGHLRSHVTHLRRKLSLPDSGPGSIKAAPGLGYSLSLS